MQAIRVHKTGGPEVLRYEQVDQPVPGPGQALVQVHASGVNFIDVYHRTGLYKVPLPFTPGSEAGGRVVEIGPGVSEVKVGDQVASQSFAGSYAELSLARADRLLVMPEGLSPRVGAAVMLQGLTAHYLACSTFPLDSTHTCLVHAAAGGVGLLLCQIARIRGARVIGTVSTEEKAELARSAGADEVILYTQQDFEVETKRLTNGAGVHVVYDSVGRTTFAKSLNCLAPRGMLVLFGQSSGALEPVDLQILSQKGSLYVTRPSLAHYVATPADLLARASAVLGWIADGSLKVLIGREFPLSDAMEAHVELESRRTMGKVLLIP
ncbi:MAG TPA: quinone oxidoreductase [Gemmatimonadales bacterium]|nr:quinone oxidoreductase [Gemmatimonadales bacterium]